ncbi:uncharacterized protein LOC131250944 isoform X2 [Magnolia sinica]|nr:uncharacterized protein LOC131250944 isoform X2 [Magnolia sinica]XP_058107365.1 uncharacterized protein LOC131250944 isoform X2 [Magnolia sinica]XP_058107371.1 uncharacterized protein LOC131250944 isoform X2 [Magnolia sinica]
MGNCNGKTKKLSAETSSIFVRSSPVVRVYGSESSLSTYRVRIALLYKTVALQFVSSDTIDTPILQCGTDTVSGSYETLLRYIDEKFPNPPLVPRVGEWVRAPIPAIVVTATLQHRSMAWHLDRLVMWVEDLADRKRTRGDGRAVDPTMGSPRMEVKKLGRIYSQLLELMLEHAQMEERIVFPVLERADRGICRAANEEHARDLPIMNGIKEDIKSIGVLEAGGPAYQEAIFTLSARLKTLQEHSKDHFEEEERELLPLLEAVDMNKERQESVVAQCLEVMEGTHSSHLFQFLMDGLKPLEAMQYLDTISRCSDRQRVSSLHRALMARMEGTAGSTNWEWDPQK